jgi:mannose-6-phosphate isomerase-like protein (cupin superfamily)
MSTSTTGRIHDPVHRVSYRFETEGQSLWVFTRLEPGGHLPEHFHPTLQERWEVLEGTAAVKLDGRWSDLTAEDEPVVVARGVRHELRNTGGGVAHLRTEVTPAGRLQEFLTESARAAREGLYNARNLPTGLRGAAWLTEFALRFSDETVMCSPPPALQRAVLPTAARLIRRRLRGHGERRTRMIKWAGRLIVLYGAAHTLGALTAEGAARHAGAWFSGELWEDDLANMSPANSAYWLSVDSFGVPLIVVGLTVLWLDRRGITPPPFIAWTLGTWTVVDAVILLLTPWPILLLANILLLVGARRARHRGSPTPGSVTERAGH